MWLLYDISLSLKQAQFIEGNDAYKSNAFQEANSFIFETPSVDLATDGRLKPDDLISQTCELQAAQQIAGVGFYFISCVTSSDCSFTYSSQYTPLFYNIDQPVTWAGRLATYELIFSNAKNLKEASTLIPIESFTVEGVKCYFGNQNLELGDQDEVVYFSSSTSISTWGFTQIPCIIQGDIVSNQQADIQLELVAGYPARHWRATTFTFDPDDSFLLRTVPRIDSMSYNKGSTLGGQQLILQGTGFTTNYNHEAYVKINHETECRVTEHSLTLIKCITQPEVLTSNNATQQTITNSSKLYRGGHGLIRSIYYGVSSIPAIRDNANYFVNPELSGEQTAYLNPVPSFQEVVLTPQSERNSKHSGIFTQVYQTLFKAPKNATYRFQVTDDDEVAVYFNPLGAYYNRSYMVTLIHAGCCSGWDTWYPHPESRASQFITLQENKLYYMEIFHKEATGSDFMQLGVEIENDTPHPSNKHETQQFGFHVTPQREVHHFYLKWNGVENDSLQFGLRFFYEDQGFTKFYETLLPILHSSSESQFKNAVKEFFDYSNGVSANQLIVTKVYLDGTLQEIEPELSSWIKWSVIVDVSVPKLSTSVRNPTEWFLDASDFDYVESFEGATGLNGTYKLKFQNTNIESAPIPWNADSSAITSILHGMNHNFVNRISVSSSIGLDSVSHTVMFIGVNEDIPQLIVVNEYDIATQSDPLHDGDLNLAVVSSSTPVPFSYNIFLIPASYDLFYTPHFAPQVTLQLGNSSQTLTEKMMGGCLNCNYTFINLKDDGQYVQSCTIVPDSENKKVVIEGLGLTNVISITWAGYECAIVVSEDTRVECEIPQLPVAGVYSSPLVYTEMGLLPLNETSSCESIEVDPVISEVLPTIGVLSSGFTLVTINGAHFQDQSLVASQLNAQIEVTIGNRPCTINSVTATTIQCVSTSLSDLNLSQTTLIVTINSKSVQFTNIPVISQLKNIISLIPTVVGTTSKTTLTLYISGYQDQQPKEKWSVQLKDSRRMNVVNSTYEILSETGEGVVKLQVKYPGVVEAGEYQVEVMHSEDAMMGELPTLRTGVFISEISPRSGSIYGGTILTLTGGGFQENDFSATLAQVALEYCTILSITSTQVKCIVPPKPLSRNGKLEEQAQFVVVINHITQVSLCTHHNGTYGCRFQYLFEAAGQVTSMSYDASTKILQYKGNFSAYSQDVSQVTVEIIDVDGNSIELRSSSVDNESISFEVTNLPSMKARYYARNLRLGSQGYPRYGFPTFQIQLIIEPELHSISPNQGYLGGQKILITGWGFVSISQNFQLQQADGTPICASNQITVLNFKEATCFSATSTSFFSGTNTQILFNGSTNFQCSGDLEQCQFQTLSLDQTPRLESAIISGNDLILQGLALPNEGVEALISLRNGTIQSSQVAYTSPTSMRATFSNGIPPGIHSVQGTITVIETSRVYHLISTVQVDQPIDESSTFTQNFITGYGGQQLYSFPFPEAGTYGEQAVSLTICETLCVYSSESDQSHYKCEVPSIDTKYTATVLGIQPILFPLLYNSATSLFDPACSSATNCEQAFDGSVISQFSHTAQNCNIGITAKSGWTIVASSFRIFINRAGFNNGGLEGAVLKGSNSGSAQATQILTIETAPLEGWNQYIFTQGEDELVQPTTHVYDSFTLESPNGGCIIASFEIRGNVIKNQETEEIKCPVKVQVYEKVKQAALEQYVTYSGSVTPSITGIDPRYGNVKGNQVITFSGSGFGTDPSLVKILIDTIQCSIRAEDIPFFSESSFRCLTGYKGNLQNEHTIVVTVEGGGRALLASARVRFDYVYYWSDTDSWNGEFPPEEGSAIHIPKGRNLYVDISTPVLSAIIVEGGLYFFPDDDTAHHITLDAHYIYVDEGRLQIGTEDAPFTSKLTITLHGNKFSPEIPIYGNKVIAGRNADIEIHGKPRIKTWTELAETATAGSSTITLNSDVDWQAGEWIVLAPTSFSSGETEKRQIQSMDKSNPGKPVVTLTSGLSYQHYAGVQDFGNGDILEMRGEVGLLSRNVLIRGDQQTSSRNKFGAHIMLHSEGDESVVGKLEYFEMRDVGQAFQLGRYPVHFHMIGTVSRSYIRGLAIHQSYNRACTLHGVHYLRIQEVVAYDIMGHTFFVEDAIETKNVLLNNLAIKSKPSFSLLNTDTTPASFWITNPDNIFIGNHAVGASSYGFWMDLQNHPTGPSRTNKVCPTGMQLGKFDGNVAHSNGKYGLRIFHSHLPKASPCNGGSSPVNTYYQNYLGYRNRRAGIIAETIGAIIFQNIKVADNKQSGVEVTFPGYCAKGQGRLSNALIVGKSQNTRHSGSLGGAVGVRTPQRDGWLAQNVRFYNFDGSQAAVGTCSHCSFPLDSRGLANTISFQQIVYTNVINKISWGGARTDILHDLDGSLTLTGSEYYVTPWYPHHNVNECSQQSALDNGALCDASLVQVRKILFNSIEPRILFDHRAVRIIKADGDEYYNGTHMNNTANYSALAKHIKQYLWHLPFVTGHSYQLFWSGQPDWTSFNIWKSAEWQPTDLGILLRFPYIDQRQKFTVSTGFANQTQLIDPVAMKDMDEEVTSEDERSSLVTGNWHVNHTEEVFSLLINGNGTRQVSAQGIRCVFNCQPKRLPPPETEPRVRYWSVAADWEGGSVPEENGVVTIKSSWDMIMDVEPVVMNKLYIYGKLTMDPSLASCTIVTNWLIIQRGEFKIGTEEEPHQGLVNITLTGRKRDRVFAYSNFVMGGSKILFVSGLFQAYGIPRTTVTRQNATFIQSHTTLKEEAIAGKTTLKVDPGLDWVSGDQIVIAPSSHSVNEREKHEVLSYDPDTGEVELKDELLSYHYGSTVEKNAYSQGSFSISAEVALLSRNIIINAGNDITWGCTILVTEWGDQNIGHLILDNVHIKGCSQGGSDRAALRIQHTSVEVSSVTNSTISDSSGWGLLTSSVTSGFIFKQNLIYESRERAVMVESSTSIQLSNNLIIGTLSSAASFDVCSQSSCLGIQVDDNIVAGDSGLAYIGQHVDRGSRQIFQRNKAHSALGGIWLLNSNGVSNPVFNGGFVAYKISLNGFFTGIAAGTLTVSNLVIAEAGVAAHLMGGGGTNGLYILSSSTIIARIPQIQGCGSSSVGYKLGCVAGAAPFKLPLEGLIGKAKGDASRGNHFKVQGVTFADFNPSQQTAGCSRSYKIINTLETASDLVPAHTFEDLVLQNVQSAGLMHLMDPSPGWANPSDCVNFPCTAPDNILLLFKNMQLTDSVRSIFPSLTSAQNQFKIIGTTNAAASKLSPPCQSHLQWNAFLCLNNSLALLQFESLDGDKFDRTFSPLFIKKQNGFSLRLNSFMDHVWDSFYTGQKRLSRFTTLIEPSTPTSPLWFNITYTGTPPRDQLFQLYEVPNNQEGVFLKIDYTKAEAVWVYERTASKDERVLQNDIDTYEREPVTGRWCGENKIIPVQNVLEFYITKGCTVILRTSNSIQLTTRIEMTFTQFFDKGGPTYFVDRMVAALGIHRSRVVVVGIWEGSSVIEAAIVQDIDDETTTEQERRAELSGLVSLLNEMVNAGTLDLGGSILDWSLITSYRNDTLLSADDVLGSAGGDTSIPIISSIFDEAEESSLLLVLGVFMLVTGLIAIGLIIVLLVLVKRKLQHKSIRPQFLEESNLSNISQMKGTEEINNQIYRVPEVEHKPDLDACSMDIPTTKQTDDQLMRSVTQTRKVIAGPILSRTDVVRKPKVKVREYSSQKIREGWMP